MAQGAFGGAQVLFSGADTEATDGEADASVISLVNEALTSLGKDHKKAAIRKLHQAMDLLFEETGVDMSIYGEC